MREITIYTDGSSRGNPGKGGYGVVMLSGDYKKEFSEGFEYTTNNRMELLSVIVALESIKIDEAQVKIYTDSKYVVDAVKKGWVFKWNNNNFKGKKNSDLWKRFLLIYPKFILFFYWVKGHAGNHYNERADLLAVSASKEKRLSVDKAYMDTLQ